MTSPRWRCYPEPFKLRTNKKVRHVNCLAHVINLHHSYYGICVNLMDVGIGPFRGRGNVLNLKGENTASGEKISFIVGKRGLLYTFFVGSCLYAKGIFKFGRIKNIFAVVLIQHLVQLAHQLIEQSPKTNIPFT